MYFHFKMRIILLNWLPWLLGMKRPGHKFSRKALKEIFQRRKKTSENENLLDTDNHQTMSENQGHHYKERLLLQYQQVLESFINTSTMKPIIQKSNSNIYLLRLQQIYWELKFITQRMKRDDDEQDAKKDWK